MHVPNIVHICETQREGRFVEILQVVLSGHFATPISDVNFHQQMCMQSFVSFGACLGPKKCNSLWRRRRNRAVPRGFSHHWSSGPNQRWLGQRCVFTNIVLENQGQKEKQCFNEVTAGSGKVRGREQESLWKITSESVGDLHDLFLVQVRKLSKCQHVLHSFSFSSDLSDMHFDH